NSESDASRYRWRPFATFAEYAKYRDADNNNVYLNGGIYICKEVSQGAGYRPNRPPAEQPPCLTEDAETVGRLSSPSMAHGRRRLGHTLAFRLNAFKQPLRRPRITLRRRDGRRLQVQLDKFKGVPGQGFSRRLDDEAHGS